MPHFLFEANIAHYKELFANASDARLIAKLRQLLAEEEAKIANYRAGNSRPKAAKVVHNEPRHSPPQGTDTCICGHTLIAPIGSTYATDEVANHWECSACGRQWKTTAPSHSNPADPKRNLM
jgi:hypothetical protein